MTQLPPLPLINGALLVDNSMLELLTTCPRQLEYNKLHKRISANESPSLTFGSAIHLGMELRYKTCGNLPTDPVYDSNISSLLEKFFLAHPVPVEDYRNFNWALQVLHRYNAKYQQEEFDLLEYEEPLDCNQCAGVGAVQTLNETGEKQDEPCVFCDGSGKNKIMVELPFTVDLFWWEGWVPIAALDNDFPREQILNTDLDSRRHLVRIRVLYCGRIDLPHLIGEDLFVMDHKTTSLLGAGFYEQMRMSAQQKGYCWSLQKLLQRKVRGYQVNTIRIKEPPKYVTEGKVSRSGKSATVESWWDESLQRERYYLNEGEIEEWHQNTIELINEFFWHYQQGVFPKKTTWCVAKYGKCSYYDVCSLFPIESRGMMLHSGNYMENKWTPLLAPSQSKQQG